MSTHEELASLFDPVRRFKAFLGEDDRDAALLRLRDVVPDLAETRRNRLFDDLSAIYDRAREAVFRHPRRRRFKLHPFATRKDIDIEACMPELDDIAPAIGAEMKRHVLEWVIYWEYVR